MSELNAAQANFHDRCRSSWIELFDVAKDKEELQFALALSPEFRGMQDPGWSTAEEASRALDQYLDLLVSLEPAPARTRIALSLYSHLSEASGLYEVPKKHEALAVVSVELPRS